MKKSTYKQRFMARFDAYWPKLIPFMLLVYAFDIVTRFITNSPMTAATVNAYIAIPIATLMLAVALAFTAPAFPPIIYVFKKIISNKLGLWLTIIAAIALIIYIFGWWSIGVLFLLKYLDGDFDTTSLDLKEQPLSRSERLNKKRDAALDEAAEKLNRENRFNEQKKNW